MGDLRLWWRRHHRWRQCESTAAGAGYTLHCTRRMGHDRYDPLHFNVFEQLAWRLEMVRADYPSTDDACRAIELDAGHLREQRVPSTTAVVAESDG